MRKKLKDLDLRIKLQLLRLQLETEYGAQKLCFESISI